MSNKELRKALLIRYGVFLKRRWYYLLLLIIYIALGIMEEIGYMRGKGGNNYMVAAAVFAIVGIVAISAVEVTRHERCQYIVPLSYDERKRFYLIGVLLNITTMMIICVLFIGITIAINKEYGVAVMKVFAAIGLPYIIVASFQKIIMFKGKKKRDNPNQVYISYLFGAVLGIMAVILLFQFEFLFKQPEYLRLVVVLFNLSSISMVIFSVREIIKRDTDYENVKVNQMKALKKLM